MGFLCFCITSNRSACIIDCTIIGYNYYRYAMALLDCLYDQRSIFISLEKTDRRTPLGESLRKRYIVNFSDINFNISSILEKGNI